MFYRVKKVEPREDFTLLVTFQDGKRKCYDVKPLTEKRDEFRSLTEVDGLFGQVRTDTGGYGVSWNDEIDLSCNELYENGTPA